MADSQFSDHEEKRFSIFSFKISSFNTKRLVCTQNIEAYILILICIVLLAVPARNNETFGYILAGFFFLFGLLSAVRWLKPSHYDEKVVDSRLPIVSLQRLDTPFPSYVEGLISFLMAGALVLYPDTLSLLAIRSIGVYLIIRSLFAVYLMISKDSYAPVRGPIWHVLMVAIGAFLLVWPEAVLEMISSVVAVAGLIVAAIVILVNLFAGRTRALALNRFVAFAKQWLSGRKVTKTEREHLYETIFYEGRNTRLRTNHFIVLMVLASTIASFGVISDSTAVVIGAMLVAPLMTPLMAVATSIVMGWPQRLLRSVTLTALGTAVGVGVGWLAGVVVPGEVSIIENAEIASRVLPTMLDLGIAVAAGAAGAYSISRPDLSNSLSGVAVSIALVPPLAVTGVTLQQGAITEASGSFLLFLTNAVAIIIAGGIVLVLTGVTPMSRVKAAQRRFKTVLLVVEIMAIIVIGSLILNGENIASNAFTESQTRLTITEWLGGDESDFRLNSLRFEEKGRHLVVEVTGPESPPSALDLQQLLKNKNSKDYSIDLRFTAQNRQIVR